MNEIGILRRRFCMKEITMDDMGILSPQIRADAL